MKYRRRFTIAGLLGLVLVFALGLAAIRQASVLWTAGAATITLALLLTAVVGTIWLRGPDQAYWGGFALFGWSYVILANWDWVGGQFGHDLTSGFGDLADLAIPVPRLTTNTMPGDAMDQMATRSVKLGNFVQIGRSLITLIFALLGGFIARTFADRTESARREQLRPETTHG